MEQSDRDHEKLGSWLAEHAELHEEDRPDQLAEEMQDLIHSQAVAVSAFTQVDQGMQEPLEHPQPDHTAEHGNEKAMDGGMGCEPPLPSEGLILAWAFFDGHPIALEGEITDEMAHGQKEKSLDG